MPMAGRGRAECAGTTASAFRDKYGMFAFRSTNAAESCTHILSFHTPSNNLRRLRKKTLSHTHFAVSPATHCSMTHFQSSFREIWGEKPLLAAFCPHSVKVLPGLGHSQANAKALYTWQQKDKESYNCLYTSSFDTILIWFYNHYREPQLLGQVLSLQKSNL